MLLQYVIGTIAVTCFLLFSTISMLVLRRRVERCEAMLRALVVPSGGVALKRPRDSSSTLRVVK